MELNYNDINSNQDTLRAELNRIYLQSGLSLGTLAIEIKVSPKLLSRFLTAGGIVKHLQLKKIIYYVQQKREQLDNPFTPSGSSRG